MLRRAFAADSLPAATLGDLGHLLGRAALPVLTYRQYVPLRFSRDLRIWLELYEGLDWEGCYVD